LEAFDLCAHRRLRDSERSGGARETALIVEGYLRA
jgi:hypothetical protein